MESRQEYDPWGRVRQPPFPSAPPLTSTDFNYTGQRLDDSGLLYYNARYYDPVLGRFVSPDSIVPGVESGKGGAAASVGAYQNHKLTVDFHEPGFVSSLQEENSLVLAKGFWFQLEQEDRNEVNDPWGPTNPQALNRYSYVLNNPLRYTDPLGHQPIERTAPIDLGDGFRARVDNIYGSSPGRYEIHVYRVMGGQLHLVAIYTQNPDGSWNVAHKGNPYRHQEEFAKSNARLTTLDASNKAKGALRRIGASYGLTRTVIDDLFNRVFNRGKYDPRNSNKGGNNTGGSTGGTGRKSSGGPRSGSTGGAASILRTVLRGGGGGAWWLRLLK